MVGALRAVLSIIWPHGSEGQYHMSGKTIIGLSNPTKYLRYLPNIKGMFAYRKIRGIEKNRIRKEKVNVNI